MPNELGQVADAVVELAEKLHDPERRHIGEDDHNLLIDAAEMMKSAQNEFWQLSILIQSYRVVIQDIGNST